MDSNKHELILRMVAAIFLPPAAAFWQVRLGTHFWINLALTIGAWIPGIIHAMWLIFRDRYDFLNAERS